MLENAPSTRENSTRRSQVLVRRALVFDDVVARAAVGYSDRLCDCIWALSRWASASWSSSMTIRQAASIAVP